MSNLLNALSFKFGSERYWIENERPHVWIFPHELITNLRSLKTEFSFIFLVDLTALDNREFETKDIWQKDFELVIHLLNLEESHRLTIHVPLDSGDLAPDVSIVYENAKDYLVEVYDLFGIACANEDYKKRVFLSDDFNGHPLLKDFDPKKKQQAKFLETPKEKSSLYFNHEEKQKGWAMASPYDSVNNPLGRFLVELEDSHIKQVISDLGITHRGLEKLLEKKTYHEAFSVVNKLNHVSSITNEIVWAKSIEELIDLDISDRAKAIRMVFLEFARICEHNHFFINICRELGLKSLYADCIRIREVIFELFESYSGNRIHLEVIEIGGMKKDVPIGWVTDALDVLKYLGDKFTVIQKELTSSRWWMLEINGNDIAPENAISLGLTGPSLRACGVNYDLRKNQTYYFYDEVDFKIPLGINGNGYDRYLVRMEEVYQSLSIITQVLDNLPIGKITEVPVTEFPKGQIYSSIEAPNGELGFSIFSDGSDRPYRVKARVPSFPLIMNISQFTEGLHINKFDKLMKTFNLVATEYDR